MTPHQQDAYDVVVIGGGAAGLGGALVLAQSRRSVVVVDGGPHRNAPAAGVHGHLTGSGLAPVMDDTRTAVDAHHAAASSGTVLPPGAPAADAR